MRADASRPSWIWPALVGLIAAAVYLNTLGNGYALDDVGIVRDNPHLGSLSGVPLLFARPYWPDASGAASGLYRPVALSTFAVDRALFGGSAAGAHAVNVALHALVSVLAWFALRRVATHYGTALLAALLFAVHPVHVEAVANLVGRAELLAAAFVLGAWLCHRRSPEASTSGRALVWDLGAAMSYGLAVLSKETAVVAPLVFLADDLGRAGSRNRARAWALLAGALAATLMMRAAVLGGLRGAADAIALDNPVVDAAPFVRVATALWVQVRYVLLMVWPARLCSDYSFEAIPVVRTALDPRFAAGSVLALAILALVVHGWRGRRPVLVGTTAWIAFFLPASNLIFPVGALMAERLAYLPSVGFCLLAGHLGAALAAAGGRPRLRRIAVVAASALAVVALGIRTWERNPAWRDNASLALGDVRVMPRSAKLQAGAGIVLAERGEIPEAERHFLEALRIYPDYAQVHYNLGILMSRRRAWSGAVEHLLRSAVLSPANPRPREALSGLLEDPSVPEELRRRVEEHLGDGQAPADR
jgi:hypothetical protein